MNLRQAGRRLDLCAQPKFHYHGNKGQPHNILHGSIESAIPEKTPARPNISGLSAIQADLQAILCKFWGVNFGHQGDLNQKLKNNVLQRGHGELMAKKWLDSIEKQKRRINLKFVTDRQTARQSQLLTIIDSQARSGDQYNVENGALRHTRKSHVVPMSQDTPSRSQTCSACRSCDYNHHPSQLSLDIQDIPDTNTATDVQEIIGCKNSNTLTLVAQQLSSPNQTED